MKGSYLLKVLFKDAYRYISSGTGREFLRLCWQIGHKKRYDPVNVTVAGRPFRVPDAMSFLWQYHEIFYQQAYNFKPASEQPVIIDCGSNVGLSVLYFKSIFPNSKILAFEADTAVFEYLKQNVAPQHPEVSLNQKAIWINNDGVKFQSEGSDGGSIASDSGAAVESVRLRDQLQQFEKIDFLKIDIEGAESEVLNDCWDELSRVENLFFEYHSYLNRDQELGRMLVELEKQGFRYFVKTEKDRATPLVNHGLNGESEMDMRLNVYCYRGA